MILMVGSEALNKVMGWNRKTGDVDYWVTADSIKGVKSNAASKGYTFTGISADTLKFAKEGHKIVEIKLVCDSDDVRNSLMRHNQSVGTAESVATLGTLRLLKESHKYLKNSPHFTKTMRDVAELRQLYPNFTLAETEMLNALEKVTYDYSHPNLKQDKKGFFSGDGVDYIYDHDSIHEVVALATKPAYTNYQHPEDQVKVSRELWDNLPHRIKLAGVIEESMVLALERHQVPNGFKPDSKKSFEMALQKICTSITSGWFREFAYNNYWEAMSMAPTGQYVQRFRKAVENNEVKGYTP